MIVVIIAGGSGTRLWPISTPSHPKHLLKIDKDHNSILQNTYLRAKKLTDKVYVVSEQSHVAHVKRQLTEIDEKHLITEPARRGTGNCIIAALIRLDQQEDSDEPIAFIHADHFIRDIDGFIRSFDLATATSANTGRIVLVGIEPTHPATGFGYIQKEGLLSKNSWVYEVASFKEKPDFETAQRYLRSGNYLWNCGYFVGSNTAFREKMRHYAPEMFVSYEKLLGAQDNSFNDIYLALKDEAIDYGLIEKVKDLLVVPASFDWMDLGTFSDLAHAVESDSLGNYIKGHVEIDEVENSYIENQETKPVAVIGLDNCVVVNTKDGLLVTRKDLSQRVGNIAKKINLQK